MGVVYKQYWHKNGLARFYWHRTNALFLDRSTGVWTLLGLRHTEDCIITPAFVSRSSWRPGHGCPTFSEEITLMIPGIAVVASHHRLVILALSASRTYSRSLAASRDRRAPAVVRGPDLPLRQVFHFLLHPNGSEAARNTDGQWGMYRLPLALPLTRTKTQVLLKSKWQADQPGYTGPLPDSGHTWRSDRVQDSSSQSSRACLFM